jgi:hypothetical protein
LTNRALFNTCAILFIGFAITWGLPNIRQMFFKYQPTCEDIREDAVLTSFLTRNKFFSYFQWKPTVGYAWLLGLLFSLTIMGLTKVSEFLYFQF